MSGEASIGPAWRYAPPAEGKTPGQAVWESLHPGSPPGAWRVVNTDGQAEYEAAAQAAIDAAISASAKRVAEHGWPAPDIAAERRERDGLRTLAAEILGCFAPVNPVLTVSSHTAVISADRMAEWRQRAGTED